MDRAFTQGYLEIDFPAVPFGSPLRMLMASLKLFVSHFRTIAAITLLVFLPGNLILQILCDALDISLKGLPFYLAMESVDLVLASLVAPALIYGLVRAMAGGQAPGLSDCLRWGKRQWGKTLWNEIKVNITVILWGALLIVPGIAAMIRLIFTDVVVAIEGDLARDPMASSEQLSKGRRWLMFGVLAPIAVVNMAAMLLIMDWPGIENSRVLFAIADSVLNIFGQLSTVAALVMYLGLGVGPRKQPAGVHKKTAKL